MGVAVDLVAVLRARCAELEAQRDRARDIAVGLEDEAQRLRVERDELRDAVETAERESRWLRAQVELAEAGYLAKAAAEAGQ